MKLTHTGLLRGDARTGDQRPKVMLRETKNFWVDAYGSKYRKTSGWKVTSEKFPLWHLDVATVKQIE